MRYTEADIATLKANQEWFRQRMAAANAGQVFDSQFDYESFKGQWDDNSRRLGIALKQRA